MTGQSASSADPGDTDFLKTRLVDVKVAGIVRDKLT